MKVIVIAHANRGAHDHGLDVPLRGTQKCENICVFAVRDSATAERLARGRQWPQPREAGAVTVQWHAGNGAFVGRREEEVEAAHGHRWESIVG